MPGSNEQQQQQQQKSPSATNTNPNSDDDHRVDDSEDEESEILEESPCGRWVKRREKVDQRDVPGIDAAYLAMDTEEGVEVVWNEVLFSERKNFKAQEDQIRQTFDNLTHLEHPNIVKFHKYWTDTNPQTEKPRVVFITEYMSSGSLKQFLKRTKKSGKKLPLAAWKRWCTQILSALNYLHSCNPPIIHGNLTCDTIFIQHNGLVKIGSVAPDAIHHHVKSFRENIKNMHYVAPEYGTPATEATPAVDIYSFGMCALEMAALEIQGNGDSGTLVTSDHINRTIESLEDPDESPVIDFVRTCIQDDPVIRPGGRELLFHPALFEVPSLKLISAHALVKRSSKSESISDEVLQRLYEPNRVIAEMVRKRRETDPAADEKDESGLIKLPYWISDLPGTEKLEKYLEDVKYGIYPMTCYELPVYHPVPSPTPEIIDSVKSNSPEPNDNESRRVMNMMCNVKSREDGPGLLMTILVRMDDKMNRQLSCVVSETDSALDLANELVFYGFIHEADRDKLMNLIEDSLYNRLTGGQGPISPHLSSCSDSSSSGTITGNGSSLYNPLSQHNLGTLTSCN